MIKSILPSRQFSSLAVFIFFVCCGFVSHAQTFEVYKNDTVNRTDVSGMKQGKWIILNKEKKSPEFADNALMEEVMYRDNKREGVRKVYFANGKVKSEVVYKNNRPGGYAKFYYPTGILAEEGNWVYGGWDGKYKNYYEAGTISEDLQYAYGKKDGPQKQYYPNGKLKFEGYYKAGVADGVQKEYDETGKLTSEVKYVNGEMNQKESKFYLSEDVKSENEQSWTQVMDTIGVFTGTGYFKLKNRFGLPSKEGKFANGQISTGKLYYYDDDKRLTKIIIYKDGKVVQTVEEKK